jgi:hypothetical protein
MASLLDDGAQVGQVEVERQHHRYLIVGAGDGRHDHRVDERRQRSAVHHARRLAQLITPRNPHAAVVPTHLFELQVDQLGEVDATGVARELRQAAVASAGSSSKSDGSGMGVKVTSRRYRS